MGGVLRRGLVVLSVLGLSGLLLSCGGQKTRTEQPMSMAPEGQSAAPGNACPAEGCRIRIVSAERAGKEIRLAFEANFNPDVSRNHFHVFWDRYTAKQVSIDAGPRFGVTVGQWVPTADNPFTTRDEAAVGMRGQSTTLCVTAGDRNHNVIDPSLVDCRDVSSLLSG